MLLIVLCICVGQKYENVYYILRFNMWIRGAKTEHEGSSHLHHLFHTIHLSVNSCPRSIIPREHASYLSGDSNLRVHVISGRFNERFDLRLHHLDNILSG